MPPPVEFKTAGTERIHTDMNAIENGPIADETCDALCRAAREKSLELGIDISFAVSDADGLPRMFRRYGDALVLSATLVPAKAHTAAVARLSTGELAKCAAEGGPLFGINSADPRIVFVAGGFPLSAGGKVVGGSEAQDREIGERVVEVFNKIANGRG